MPWQHWAGSAACQGVDFSHTHGLNPIWLNRIDPFPKKRETMRLLKRSSLATLWLLLALANMGQEGGPVEDGAPNPASTGDSEFSLRVDPGTVSSDGPYGQTFRVHVARGSVVPVAFEVELVSGAQMPIVDANFDTFPEGSSGTSPLNGLYRETILFDDASTTFHAGSFAAIPSTGTVPSEVFHLIPREKPAPTPGDTFVGGSGPFLFIEPRASLVGKILKEEYWGEVVFFERTINFGDDAEANLSAIYFPTNQEQTPAGFVTQRVQTLRLLSDRVKILPHVPFGAFGNLRLINQVVINNPHDEDVQVRMDFFQSTTGAPLQVPLEGVRASTQNLTVGARSSRLLEIESEDDIETAWAVVTASEPVGVSTNFLTVSPDGAQQSSGMVVAEAGIAASGVSTKHVLNILRTGIGVSTAIAAVNVTSSVATVKVTLLRDGGAGSSLAAVSGIQGQEVVGEAVFPVGPRVQAARFFDDLFEIPAGNFAGTIVLESDASLAVASIKTANGIQSSSLPSGSP